MAIDILNTVLIKQEMEIFMERMRPPKDIREKLDISFKIENQSVIVHEIRLSWKNKNLAIESPIAKATYVKATRNWKVYWMRRDLKWHSYEPQPVVAHITDFITLIEEDKHNCFWR